MEREVAKKKRLNANTSNQCRTQKKVYKRRNDRSAQLANHNGHRKRDEPIRTQRAINS